MSGSTPRAELWEAASVRPGRALRVATTVCAGVTVVGAGGALIAGPVWGLSVLVGGGSVTLVLAASTAALVAVARRVPPTVALGVALLLYLVVVVGLFVVAASARAGASAGDTVRPIGISVAAVAVLVIWTATLLAVHVRSDRPRAGRGRRTRS